MNAKSIDAKTTELIRASESDVSRFAPAVRDWYKLFPESFYRTGAANFTLDKDLFTLRLMASDAECGRFLCDTDLLTQPGAVHLARTLFAVAPDLDIRLARLGVEWMPEGPRQLSLRRCLLLLEALETSGRVNTSLVQLLNSSDSAVRSKVFTLLMRSSFNENNIRTWLRDPDPRIRANIIECLANTLPVSKGVHDVVLVHLDDPNGRIAANAALLLFRAGTRQESCSQLTRMARSDNPSVRSSAAWAMGRVADGCFRTLLNELRTDSDSRVRRHALRSMTQLHRNAPPPPEPARELETDNKEVNVELLREVANPNTEGLKQPSPEPVWVTRTFGRLL